MSGPLGAALNSLAAEERAALLLRDAERRSLDAVAKRLGCSVETARMHIAQGRIKMLRYFAEAC